jgi:hypothetical protein
MIFELGNSENKISLSEVFVRHPLCKTYCDIGYFEPTKILVTPNMS